MLANRPARRAAATCGALLSLLLLTAGHAAPPQTSPVVGLRESTPQIHALVGARIVVAPGKVIERGTIVLRDGVIVQIGADIQPRPDARVWQLEGKTIYPGLIDAYSRLPADALPKTSSQQAGHWNRRVTPELRADEYYRVDASLNKLLRSQGITARLAVPAAGLVKGMSTVVSTADGDASDAILQPQVALHLALTIPRSESQRDVYPNSPMGALTLVRQTLHDAQWYRRAWSVWQTGDEIPRPERNAALAAMQSTLDGQRPVIVDSSDVLYFLRADQVAREFSLDTIVLGSGEEYRLLDAVRKTGRRVIVPVNFPKPPAVESADAARDVSLERLMHWDHAPENPGLLAEQGVPIALCTDGLSDRKQFLTQVRRAVHRGLSADDALRAMTVTPAEWFGLSDRLGTLEEGKIANLLVTDGDLFDEETQVLETWVDGQRYEVQAPPLADLRGQWLLRLIDRDGKEAMLELSLTGKPGKLQGTLKREQQSAKLNAVALDDTQWWATFDGTELEWDGIVQLSATLLADDLKGDAAASSYELAGHAVWPDGTRTPLEAHRKAKEEPQEEQPGDKKTDGKQDDPADAARGKRPRSSDPPPTETESPAGTAAPDKPEQGAERGEADKSQDDDEKQSSGEQLADEPRNPLFPVNFPLGAYGLASAPEQPELLLIQGATVWTCSARGTLEEADVLVERGVIKRVGRNLDVPQGAVVVDGRGKHVTPGIIDCHSHIATDGGVNESSQSITAEVRIGDFIDPFDIAIYRQLAGGVTCANILHGSANTIGGQNQVIKFRWGALPEELKFREAPPGIKFALGENVKQSNWGDRYDDRYPQTRMGVEQLVRDAFQAAIDYRRAWDNYRKFKRGLPPRVDLELEAIAEILAGKRLVHCHAYRQDEILALLRTCQEYHVRIATFQHVLEGYKIADVLAEQGVGGSSFSDWWAYKFEVYDAIPYNGALLHNAGVVTSFNSDDAELARRLNTEAAKAMKYGALPAEEALKFVTLHPAMQLGIDRWVGSIEPGKHADLAIWNGPPLSTLSICVQTWVDGRKYFDRAEQTQREAETAQRRAALVQRALAMKQQGGEDDDEEEGWPREDLFCGHHHDHDHGHDHD